MPEGFKRAAPYLALAAAVAAALMPLIGAAPSFAPARAVVWMPAASDLRPRAAVEGERLASLRRPEAGAPAPPRQYVFAFERASAPAGPLGVFLPTAPEGARVFINALQAQTERRGPALFAEIPREGLQQGANRIQIVAEQTRAHEGVRALAFGPREDMRAAFERLARLRAATTWFIAVAGAAASLLGFLAVALSTARRRLFLAALATLAVAAIGALDALGAAPGLIKFQPFASTLLMGAAALFLLLLTGGDEDEWPRAYKLALRLSVVAIALAAAAAGLAQWRLESALLVDQGARALGVLSGAASALAIALTPRTKHLPADLSAIASLLALFLLAALAARIDVLGAGALLGGEALAGVAGSLGLALAAAAFAARLYGDAEEALQKRLGLGRLVKEQEAQLRAQRAALDAEIAKRAVLEERERFSRDVHDGVGGSLVSLLMQARIGKLKEEDLAPALERALEDLRLMVDALDHSRISLSAAFSTFQTRIAPAFAAAGIELDWRQDELPEGALAGPGELMQVFRILQEACANVLKHSKARRALVRIGWNAGAARFELDVEDDGAAQACPPAPNGSAIGHGLRNMSQRAEKIGGALTIERSDMAGWAVRLRAPAVSS